MSKYKYLLLPIFVREYYLLGVSRETSRHTPTAPIRRIIVFTLCTTKYRRYSSRSFGSCSQMEVRLLSPIDTIFGFTLTSGATITAQASWDTENR